MALAHSPKIVTDGLVFAYDMGNTSKSWKGKPATNFLTNGHFSGGNKIAQESGSNPTNEIIVLRNPGSSEYVLRQTGTVGYTEYQLNLTTQLAAGTTYVMSGWYAESPNYSCADGSRMFHSRAYSTSGAHVSLGIGIGTILETKVVDGITWKYCYATITTPADYSNVFEWYVGYGSSAYTGHRYYTDLQVEIGTLPSRFVNGTRSNTQVLLDLTKRNTINAVSLTYASDNTFAFDGANNYMHFSKNRSDIGITNTYSLETVFKRNTNDGGRIIFGGQGWNWGIMSTTNGCRVEHFYSNDSGATYNYLVSNDNVVSTGTWVHVVATFNHLGNMCTYINGKLTATTNMSAYTNYWYNSPFCIGGYNYAPYRFNGQIPIAKVYAKELTAIEVAQNFNALRGRYGI